MRQTDFAVKELEEALKQVLTTCPKEEMQACPVIVTLDTIEDDGGGTQLVASVRLPPLSDMIDPLIDALAAGLDGDDALDVKLEGMATSHHDDSGNTYISPSSHGVTIIRLPLYSLNRAIDEVRKLDWAAYFPN